MSMSTSSTSNLRSQLNLSKSTAKKPSSGNSHTPRGGSGNNSNNGDDSIERTSNIKNSSYYLGGSETSDNKAFNKHQHHHHMNYSQSSLSEINGIGSSAPAKPTTSTSLHSNSFSQEPTATIPATAAITTTQSMLKQNSGKSIRPASNIQMSSSSSSYVNSIINRSRSPITRSQQIPGTITNFSQSSLSRVSNNGQSHSNNSRQQALTTPTKSSMNRIFAEQSPNAQIPSSSSSHARSHAQKSPRQLSSPNNHSLNHQPTHFELIQQSRSANNSKASYNNNGASSASIEDDQTQQQQSKLSIPSSRQYSNPTQMRKVHQQSHSYHNLQQYLQANGSIATPSNNNSTAKKPPSHNAGNSSFTASTQVSSNEGYQLNPAPAPRLAVQTNRLNVISIQGIQGASTNNSINQGHQPNSLSSLALQNQPQQQLTSATAAISGPASSSSQLYTHSTQKTNSSVSSACQHCSEVERELEMLRSIMVNCKNCSHSFLSISDHHHSYEKKAAAAAASSNTNNGTSDSSVNVSNPSVMILHEKIANMRLQEQVQQLTKQLEAIAVDRDALKSGSYSQTEQLISRIQAQEMQIKNMRVQVTTMEKKLESYSELKQVVEKVLLEGRHIPMANPPNEMNYEHEKLQQQSQNEHALLTECNFLKDFISQYISAITAATTANATSTKDCRNVNLIGSAISITNSSSGSMLGMPSLLVKSPTTQQLEMVVDVPSTIKALEIVNRIKNGTSTNPFISKNLL